MAIRVLINGASGRMGQASVAAIEACDALELVGVPSAKEGLQDAIAEAKADVVLDFTNAASVHSNTKAIIEAGAAPVIGTSGLSAEEIATFHQRCLAKNIGGLVVPNFSIGAVLMMRFAEQAAKFFPHSEIIEMHHENKQDAPSGTAMATAARMQQAAPRTRVMTEKVVAEGARGANVGNIPVHAVRLPGFVAHQMVLFGGNSETLTLRHDTTNRNAFMPGILLACEKVQTLQGFLCGLEHVMETA